MSDFGLQRISTNINSVMSTEESFQPVDGTKTGRFDSGSLNISRQQCSILPFGILAFFSFSSSSGVSIVESAVEEAALVGS